MRNLRSQFSLGIVLAGIFVFAISNNSTAGTLYGLDLPDRVPRLFLVTLKREKIASLQGSTLTNRLERTTRSLKWQAASSAVDAEVAQKAAKLMTAYHGRLSFPIMGTSLIPIFTIEASDEDAKAMADDPNVERIDASVAIADTLLTTQSPAPSWGLDRIDKGDSSTTAILDNSYSYAATGAGANVYILDSGVMTNNIDFGGRATNDADFVGDGNNGWCASNPSARGAGHGTEVASIIGGSTYGVAKQVQLHSVRVANCAGGSNYSVIISGLQWLYYHALIRHSVLNISLEWLKGNLYATNLDNATVNFITVTQQYLADMSAAGITIVIAAGNDGANGDPFYSWPQGLRDWNNMNVEDILVGATAYKSDTVWPDTSLGGRGGPDIFAPGERVTTAWVSSTTASQSADSGTSLAAPYVSGVAALAAGLGDTSDGTDALPFGSVYFAIYNAEYHDVVPGICVVHHPAQAGDHCYGQPDVVSALVAGNNPVPGAGGGSGGGTGGGGTGGSGATNAAISSVITSYLLLSP